MDARRHRQCRYYHARWRPLLGGTPPGIGLRLRSALRQIAVAKAATVPFRILAIGAIPLSLPRGRVDKPALRGPLPACNPPTRAVAVTQSIALFFALAPQLPRLRSGELRVGIRPVRLFMCRRRRHFVVDPAELGRAQMSLVVQTEGARYLESPVMTLGDK
jgi:hypothetical protein